MSDEFFPNPSDDDPDDAPERRDPPAPPVRPLTPRRPAAPGTRRPAIPAAGSLPEDDFQVRTFNAGDFGVEETGRAPLPPPPEPIPAEPAAEPEPDTFTAVTVEPPAPEPRPAAASPAPRSARPAPRSRRHKGHSRLRVGFSAFLTLLTASAAAVLVATIFSLWTRPTFFSDEFRAGLSRVQATQRLINIQPSPLPTDIRQVHIGIIAGHSGPPQDPSFPQDPGAVCDDGLTELEINTTVARMVFDMLRQDNYTVDLLEEFDPRLENYQADVLVSVHSNSCADFGPEGTGFNVASASSRQTTRGADERLQNCLVDQYQRHTGLPRHTGLTHDMTDYHTFREVSPDTPTAIIELGFLRNDRQILTQHPETLALGIANGVRCFLQPAVYGTPPDASQDSE